MHGWSPNPLEAYIHIVREKNQSGDKFKMNNTRKAIFGILSAIAITTVSPVTSYAATIVRKVVTYHEDGVIFSGPALKSGTFTATVKTSSLDIYKSMTSNETIGKANQGDVFQILEDMGKGYVRVSYNDVEGYLSIQNGDCEIEELESVEEAMASTTQTAAKNRRQDIVDFAQTFVGGRYIYGGTNPYIGADCSGFVRYILANAAGVGLPRTSAEQATRGATVVSADQLQPGDLIFYGSGRSVNHVAMYIGNGRVVHASSAATGIKISNYNYRPIIRMANVIG